MKNIVFFNFLLIIIIFVYTKIIFFLYPIFLSYHKDNSKFSVYIKFNNYPLSQIKVSTYVETFSYYTKNNTVITPYYDNIDCLDNKYLDINCFSKIDLVKNNKYNYIWLKFEKKDKTLFVNNLDFYVYDMYNVFDNSKFKNVIYVNGSYSLYNFHLNITNNNYPIFITKKKT